MKAGKSYKKKVGALEKWMGWRVLVGKFIGIGNIYKKIPPKVSEVNVWVNLFVFCVNHS
ncbi:hypothetical protein [Chryseobacterium indoltheticum]|uniref:hypothetical protein n=1 Tax=Chryseobacterium indoltheticum TaxID=254 RepID=UPI001356615C|nr:hypothetical protein [Chryseobacterium indoltheticum]